MFIAMVLIWYSGFGGRGFIAMVLMWYSGYGGRGFIVMVFMWYSGFGGRGFMANRGSSRYSGAISVDFVFMEQRSVNAAKAD